MNSRPLRTLALTAIAPAAAFAQIELDQHLSLTGYAVASYQRTRYTPGLAQERTAFDTAKVQATATFDRVTAVVSAWHEPGAPKRATLLDAYVSVDLGAGSTVSVGKFNCTLGYEPFDAPDLPAITPATGDFLGALPGYHSGLKWDYTRGTFCGGVALVDSVYSGPYFYRGDAEVRHNAGGEAFASWKPGPKLTVTAGVGYDSAGNVISRPDPIAVYNLWCSYAFTTATSVTAELTRKHGAVGDRGYGWFLLLSQTFTARWSAVLRLSGENVEQAGPAFTKLTLAATYQPCKYLLLRAESSGYEYRRHPEGADSSIFTGLQAIVRF